MTGGWLANQLSGGLQNRVAPSPTPTGTARPSGGPRLAPSNGMSTWLPPIAGPADRRAGVSAPTTPGALFDRPSWRTAGVTALRAVSGSAAVATPDDDWISAWIGGRGAIGQRTAIAPGGAPQLASIGNRLGAWLFWRPRAWAWNLMAPPGVRRQARRDGYCAGLLLGEGYINPRRSPWHHRELRAWQAGLQDGAELAAHGGQPTVEVSSALTQP